MTTPTATPGPRFLTKREFLAGRQCHKQRWWRIQEGAPELTPRARSVMEWDGHFGGKSREQ